MRSQLRTTTKRNEYTNDVKPKLSSKPSLANSEYGADSHIPIEMATYMSEDFEKGSQFSTKSFICCDAYKYLIFFFF